MKANDRLANKNPNVNETLDGFLKKKNLRSE